MLPEYSKVHTLPDLPLKQSQPPTLHLSKIPRIWWIIVHGTCNHVMRSKSASGDKPVLTENGGEIRYFLSKGVNSTVGTHCIENIPEFPNVREVY